MASAPDAGDGTRGPEWAEMMERHKREGVISWHADRVPGVTDERLAAEMNRVARWMANPYNRVSSRLRGEAMLLRESGSATLERKAWNGTAFEPVEPTPSERGRAKSELATAELMDEAAELLERHGVQMEPAQGGEARQGGDAEGGSVHEHPVPQGCAQPPSPSPSNRNP